MATIYSPVPGNAVQGVSIDDNRRVFNFGERIAELAPQQSPFFAYLSKVGKKPTDDPVFKFLEQRHQWQRRHFKVKTAISTINLASDATVGSIEVYCNVTKDGRSTSTETAPEFLLENQRVTLSATDAGDSDAVIELTGYIYSAPTIASGKTTMQLEVDSVAKAGSVTMASSGTVAGYTDVDIADNANCMVIGSSWDEGTGKPESWRDELYDREGYTQIFKTAISLFSGTSMATQYRAIPNEYRRVWQEKLMEHKMDLEQALLYGVGKADESGSGPQRHTWGIIPYTRAYGKSGGVYNFTYSGSGYDAFVDTMEDFFHPESGNSGSKLVLASRKVLAWFQKLGSNAGFLDASVAQSSYNLDVQNIKGSFGHAVTKVTTIFGDLHFVQEPLLRGMYDDFAVAVDLKNVAYRPLVGNGVNRDTFLMTNVQNNDTDGRQDMILTECGLEISLPETHAVMKWSA